MTTRLMAVGYQPNWWEILTSPFMRNALLGGTLVALAAGLIGSISCGSALTGRLLDCGAGSAAGAGRLGAAGVGADVGAGRMALAGAGAADGAGAGLACGGGSARSAS